MEWDSGVNGDWNLFTQLLAAWRIAAWDIHLSMPCSTASLLSVCTDLLPVCLGVEWYDSPRVLPQPSTPAGVLALPGDMVVWGRLLNLILALLQSSTSLCTLCTNCLPFLGFGTMSALSTFALLLAWAAPPVQCVCRQLSRSCAEPSRAQQSLSLCHIGARCHGNAQSAALWVSRSQKWWCFCNIEVNISLFSYLAYRPLSKSTSSFWRQSPLAPCMKADDSRHREHARPLQPSSCGLEWCFWQW